MLRKELVLLMLLFSKLVSSQTYTLSGIVSGEKDVLPFATIHVKGNSLGTNTNVDGLYHLKLPAGTYELEYQYVGYSKKTETVVLNANKELNVSLKPDGISLTEVVIRAGEDPSYPIIRNAIKKRRFYRDQVASYSCTAYMKGLQRVNSIPKNIGGLIKLVGAELSDTANIKGVVYLAENVSNYYYLKPEEKEIMVSSKVSGNSQSFSFNKLSDLNISFYDNLIEMGNLSNRPFISPINDNAFLFYRYFLLGSVNEDGHLIHKIKVVPKQKSDPCFKGIIYVQDSSWRITGIDLTILKETKVKFVDTLHVRELYAPLQSDSIWMPLSVNLSFDFKVFGFVGSGYFNAHISNYNLQPGLSKEFFKNEVLKVEPDANKQDSSYWNTIRAVPLTAEEINDYREKDSLEKIRNTDRFKDSSDAVRNRPELRDVFLGYTYQRSKKNLVITLPGLITDGVQYNTVEGLNLSYKFKLNKTFEDFRRYDVSGKVRYGFSNQLWGGEMGFNYVYKPKTFSSYGIKVKSIAEQYNQLDPISPVVNSLYSLLLNENYMKMFKETGIEANYFTELSNGFYFSGLVKYMQRDPLRNTSDILFIDNKQKLFTSNDPRHEFTHDSMFSTNRAFTAEFSFILRFRQKFNTLPNQKIISGSKYPRVMISYKRAFPVLNTTANYDLLSASVSDNIHLGLFGKFSYRLRGGGFLDTRQLYFMDFKYFLGNQTIFNTNDYLSSFRLLPYYTYSADRWFAEAHAEHHFQGLVLGRIPLIKNTSIQEFVGLHFLSSNKLDYYYELNFGLEKIFRVIRFDYVLGYSPDRHLNQGFTFGLDLRF